MEIFVCVMLLAKLAGVALTALVATFVVLPLLLATVTSLRLSWQKKQNVMTTIQSALYVGRVWHARLSPKHHGFQYPLFVFCLDMEEVDNLFGNLLWPLSWIVSFRNEDHLKNGEGLDDMETKEEMGEKAADKIAGKSNNEIALRVLRLLATKTHQKCQPTLPTHRVICVTHLCYYGYCFNPVSFYYLQNKSTQKLDVVVAEVSNTPWNEMHCYVLHPDSVDQVQVVAHDNKQQQSQESATTESIHYVWPKRFHVSPFMEMDYLYDWTFHNFALRDKKNDNSGKQNNTTATTEDTLQVRASMKRGTETHFTAKMEVTRQSMDPFRIAWQLITFPTYCFIVQVWIHYEAFWLFVKGIVFVPHPNDAETSVSRAIAAIMTPLFAAKDWVDTNLRGRGGSNIQPTIRESSSVDATSNNNNKTKTS